MQPSGLVPPEQADRPLAPVGEPAERGGASVTLHFGTQVGHPDWRQTFQQLGGRLDSAASPLATVFHVSGNKASVRVEHDAYLPSDVGIHDVVVPVENATVTFEDAAEDQIDPAKTTARQQVVVTLPATVHLGVSFLSRSFTLDGTIGATVLGQGPMAVSDLMKQAGNGQLGLQYSTQWHSPVAHVSVFGARLVATDASGADMPADTVRFVVDTQLANAIQRIPDHFKTFLGASVERRTKDLVYSLQTNLTKSIANVPNGLGSSPYMLLGSILDGKTAFSTPTLADALEFALMVELDMSDTSATTLEHTYIKAQSPDLVDIASVSTAMISAISTMVATQMSYRVDGAPVVGATGAQFQANENWAPGPPLLVGIEADDCDRSAMMALSIAHQLKTSTPSQRAEYPVLAAYAALLSHYDASLVVLGARSAEASGNTRGNGIAGHAIVVVDPKVALVRAVLRGATHAKNPLGKEVATSYAKQLWTDLVSDDMIQGMHVDLKASVQRPYSEQVVDDHPLFSLAIEGTTPAYARLYETNRSHRDAGRAAATRAKSSMRALGAGLGRGLKDLSSLGASADVHGFYRHFVERTSPHSHPIWKSGALRQLGGGALQQFVYVPIGRGDASTAGASPMEVRLGEYALVPLAFASHAAASDFDVAAKPALENVAPPMGEPLALSEDHAAIYAANRVALETLAKTSPPHPASGSTLLYVLASNALVSNQMFIANTLAKVTRHAHDVLIRDVRDYYVDSSGQSVGYLAAIAVHV